MLLIVLALQIPVLIIMKQINNSEVLKAWTKVCSALLIIQLGILDTCACLTFSFIFNKSTGLKSLWLRLSSIMLVGNPDLRSLISLNLELN